MKRIKTHIIALMLLTPWVPAQSEVPTNSQARRVNLNSLRAIEVYENYSSLMNDEAEENFRYIFDNDSVKIYNDLPGLAKEDSLLLDRYIELARAQRGVFVSLANIRGGKISDGGDKWIVPITFDKEIRYNTPNGAIISSMEYYDGKPYKMEAIVEVDKDTYESHIRSLKGAIDSKKPRLSPGFFIVNMNDPRDLNVLNSGKKLRFSKYGQAFIYEPINLTYADDDMNMKVITSGEGDNRKFSFAYHPMRWRVKPYYEFGLGDAYKIDAAGVIESSTTDISLGVDFGYILPSRSKFKVGIFSGLGFSSGNINLNAANINYNYEADGNADMDGDTYIRHYELSNVTQSAKLSYMTIPLYVDFDYRINQRVSVFADLGIKMFLNMGSKIDKFSTDVYSYGVYPQYQDLMMNESWLNDFGNTSLNLGNVRADNPFKGFGADMIAGAGVRIKVVGALSVDVALLYTASLISRFETKEIGSVPSGRVSPSDIPVKYTVAAGQTIDNTLMDYCKIKNNPLKLKIGIIYKF